MAEKLRELPRSTTRAFHVDAKKLRELPSSTTRASHVDVIPTLLHCVTISLGLFYIKPSEGIIPQAALELFRPRVGIYKYFEGANLFASQALNITKT